MAESDVWHRLRDAGRKFGHFERIENMVGRGRPDVNYCVAGVEGNIELKQIARWPKRAETVVEVDHFTPQQRIWIRTRLSAGGRVYILLEVVHPSPLYVLLPGGWAIGALGKTATADAIVKASLLAEGPRFPIEKVIAEITAG